MPNAIYRRFRDTDIDACVDVFVSTFAQPPWSEQWTAAVVHDRLQQILLTPHSLGVVVEDQGILGFALGFSEAWHNGTHFYLKEMCIQHGRQRQGLGSKLLEFLKTELRERETKRIYLLTARGDASEAFYAKLGFYTSPKMILMAHRMQDNLQTSSS